MEVQNTPALVIEGIISVCLKTNTCNSTICPYWMPYSEMVSYMLLTDCEAEKHNELLFIFVVSKACREKYCYNIPHYHFAQFANYQIPKGYQQAISPFIPNLYTTVILHNGQNRSVPWVTVIGSFHCNCIII